MQNIKQLIVTSLLFLGIFLMSFTTLVIPPEDSTSVGLKDGDSIYYSDPDDTLWNVVVYVEFSVDSNGLIHDVLAEKPFDCLKCDSILIDSLKEQAVQTVKDIKTWNNLQHKDIKYEYPVHMLKLHKDVHHDVYHHPDSLKSDKN